MTNIKITELGDIGNNIAASSLVPVVNMSGTPLTQKANLQILGNLILSGAGGPSFASAATAILSQSVTNAAQPNITSTGTLTSLTVSGNVNLGSVENLTINGGLAGQVLSTDGNGVLSWANNSSISYSNNDVANYLPTFTGTVGANRISSNALSGSNVEINANGAIFTFGQGGALFWPAPGGNTWAIEPNIDNEFEIKSTSNVVISTDISNANSHFTFDSDGIFTAPSNVNLLGSRLNVGPDAISAGNLLNPTLVIANTGAQYIQAAIINNDGAGSSDWSADGAGGGDEEAWTDMGFAGFSFNDPDYTITEPGDGYLFVQGYANGLGGNMVLATGDHSNTADIIFATGGFSASNEFARIDHANSAFALTRENSFLQFAATGSISNPANTSLDPLNSNVSTLVLTPDANYSSQVLVLDPTAPGHIHLRAYAFSNIDEPAANIFLGGEDTSFEITQGSNNEARIHSGSNTWTFGNDGRLTFPGTPRIDTSADNFEVQAAEAINFEANTVVNIYTDGSGNTYQWQFGDDGTLTAPGDITIAGDITGRAAANTLILKAQPTTNTYIQLNSIVDSTIQTHANLEIVTDSSNTSQSWKFDATGNLTLPGNTIAINFADNSPAFGNMVEWTTAPAANTDPGTAGQAAYDSGGNLYVCVASNTWAKFAGTTSW